MFFLQFGHRSAPPEGGGAEWTLEWLKLALNNRVDQSPEQFDYSPWLRRSILTFGNSLFLHNLRDLDEDSALLRCVRDLLTRVAPGVRVVSVRRHSDSSSPEFESKFDMLLDLSKLGGPAETRVRADFSVATQRASVRQL